MASPVAAALCALIATGFWTLVGLAIARHLLPRPLALGAAAVIGWATHSAASLPLYVWVGLSPISVATLGLLSGLAGFSLLFPVSGGRANAVPSLPVWSIGCLCAAALALVPAIAILPKYYGDAVALADPIFDHSKSAVIDAIVRLGVPPVILSLANSACRVGWPIIICGTSAPPSLRSSPAVAAGKRISALQVSLLSAPSH